MSFPKTAVILGAGFSRNIGVPTKKFFLEKLISTADWLQGPDHVIDLEITQRIREFLEKIFGWTDGEALPTLEDVFTFIDLSAGTGHNLGREYTPAKLRAVRRFLIYKIFTVLDRAYEDEANAEGKAQVMEFLQRVDGKADYISLNWDIVLESILGRIRSHCEIDYLIEPTEVEIVDDELRLPLIRCAPTPDPVRLCKVHGSSNWVYCDNCKELFCDTGEKVAKNIYAGIYAEDVRRFYAPEPAPRHIEESIWRYAKRKACPHCGCSVGTHIATFSYRKSFRTTYFLDAWKKAEDILTNAERWLFVGYSLPDADYEFKHLLKCAQIRRAPNKAIHAVMRDDAAAETRYRSMFGPKQVQCFHGGLAEYLRAPSAFL